MQTVERVVAVVVELVQETRAAPLPDGDLPTMLLESFGLDSLDKFTLLIRLEDAFSISLDEPSALACKTCAEIAVLVDATLAQSGGVAT